MGRITFFAVKAEDSSLMEFDEGVTGPTDRKNRKRTIKNSNDSSATCPVINPLTKSYADEVALVLSVPESTNS